MDTTEASRKVAATVAAALDESHINPTRAADLTGIPRSTLLRRLTGNSAFTIAELSLIANVLDTTVEALVVGPVAA